MILCHEVPANDGIVLSDAQTTELYLRVAFGSEFESLIPGVISDRILKRAQGKAVSIIAFPQPSVPLDESFRVVGEVAEELATHSSDLRLHTYSRDEVLRLSASLVAGDRRSFDDAVLIYIGSQDELRRVASAAGIASLYDTLSDAASTAGLPLCFGIMLARTDNPNEIGKAAVLIEHSLALRECLFEEIMQTFGISNDLPAGTPSIFNDDNLFGTPTELDWKLWRIHTDHSIRSGMNIEDARHAVSAILGQLP